VLRLSLDGGSVTTRGRSNRILLLFVFGARNSILEFIYYDNKGISRKRFLGPYGTPGARTD